MIADFVGAGWAFPLAVDASGRFALAKGTAKIEQSIRLILVTYPGERPMRPEFGSLLRDFVFRSVTLDNAADLSHEVRKSLRRWEPRIDVTSVETSPAEDEEGLLYIDIGYTVKATNDERNLVFPFYTIPEDEGYL
jgi:phage baseplate assembly protein W